MLFCLLKHYLELYITDTALKVSRSLYCFILYLMVMKTISLGFGVRVSVMLFLKLNLTHLSRLSKGIFLSLALALSKCVHLPYLRHVSLLTKIHGLLLLIVIYTFT